jgi:hypothetical protein
MFTWIIPFLLQNNLMVDAVIIDDLPAIYETKWSSFAKIRSVSGSHTPWSVVDENCCEWKLKWNEKSAKWSDQIFSLIWFSTVSNPSRQDTYDIQISYRQTTSTSQTDRELMYDHIFCLGALRIELCSEIVMLHEIKSQNRQLTEG